VTTATAGHHIDFGFRFSLHCSYARTTDHMSANTDKPFLHINRPSTYYRTKTVNYSTPRQICTTLQNEPTNPLYRNYITLHLAAPASHPGSQRVTKNEPIQQCNQKFNVLHRNTQHDRTASVISNSFSPCSSNEYRYHIVNK